MVTLFVLVKHVVYRHLDSDLHRHLDSDLHRHLSSDSDCSLIRCNQEEHSEHTEVRGGE